MDTFAFSYKTTVTQVAASKEMTLLATVKSELQITDDANNGFLSTLIQQSSAAIVSFCNREFAKETLEERFRIERCATTLQLSRWPVVTVSSVVEDDVTLTADDYEIIPDLGWLRRVDSEGDPIDWGCKVTVVHVSGYVMLTTLPQDLEKACIELVKRSWFARERDPLVKSEEVPGVLRTDFWVGSVGGDTSGMPPEIAALLAPYRKHGFG